MKSRGYAFPVLLFVCILALSTIPTASAHEHREVTIAGRLVELEVGWLVEPAYVDEVNGIDFHATTVDSGNPIFGLDQALQVDVSAGDRKVTLSLTPVLTDDEPPLFFGGYDTNLIPTVEGSYTFRFFGNVNGTTVDENFQCGPTTFECVIAASDIQFPEATPSGRVVQLSLRDLQSQVSQLQAALEFAHVIGAVGIIMGVVALTAIILAARRGKRTT